MTHDQVKRNVINSALSGYFRVAVRMGLGLVTFRLLYQGSKLASHRLSLTVSNAGLVLNFRHPTARLPAQAPT